MSGNGIRYYNRLGSFFLFLCILFSALATKWCPCCTLHKHTLQEHVFSLMFHVCTRTAYSYFLLGTNPDVSYLRGTTMVQDMRLTFKCYTPKSYIDKSYMHSLKRRVVQVPTDESSLNRTDSVWYNIHPDVISHPGQELIKTQSKPPEKRRYISYSLFNNVEE